MSTEPDMLHVHHKNLMAHELRIVGLKSHLLS